tara:strand:+ start:18 stop:602 length:585 start_codon:yes stop_codon:yes gene_type:complete
MKIIKLKNCLLFMTAINSIGSKWGIKEYKKLLDGEDMIKRLTLYIAIAYYKHVKYQCGTNFRRFANDLTGKNKRTGIQFQWDDGTIVKFEDKDFINSCMFYTQKSKINPYWKENPSKLKCPQTPMEFLFEQGFIDRTRTSESAFEVKHHFAMGKYMKRTLDFLLETPYYKESLKQGSFYFPVLTSIFKEQQKLN